MQHSNKINQSGRFIMDLLQVTGQKLTSSMRAAWLLSGLLLSACSTVPQQTVVSDKVAEPVAAVEDVAVVEETPTLPLTAELTYLILTAEVAKQRGDIAGAADLYQRAAETIESPTLSSRSTQMANLTRDGQRINRALDRWSEVNPGDANVYLLKVPFLLIDQKYDEVPKAINQALTIDPEKTDFLLSRLTDNMGKLIDADNALSIMTKLDVYQSKHPEALYQYGRLAATYQRFDDALPAISEVLTAQPDHQGALVLKAKILQQTGSGEEAIRLLKSPASKAGASKFLRFTYGQLLGENNHVDASRTVFEKLYRDHPDEPDIAFALGVIAIEEQKNEQAVGYFNRLLDLGDPGQQAAYFLGVAEKQAGNVDAALTWFNSVPPKHPRYQAAQSHYVSLLAENGAMAKARQQLDTLRQQDPESAVDYYLFEASLLRDRKHYQNAFDILDKANTEHKDNIDLLYGRAMAAESLNRLDLLEKDLRQIGSFNPNRAGFSPPA